MHRVGSIESLGRAQLGGAFLLRPLGAVLSAGLAAAALYSFHSLGLPSRAWWLIGSAAALAFVWQWKLPLVPSAAVERERPFSARRVLAGAALAAFGCGLWAWSAIGLYRDWAGNFDSAWLGWIAAAAALGVGLDLAWGRGRGERRSSTATTVALVVALVVLGGAYRTANLIYSPGEGYVTQVEDLQHGLWGTAYLKGDRTRWEYIGHVWLSALGLDLGGPTLLATRIPLMVVSTLKLAAFFFWLRLCVGTIGAAAGTALLAVSGWDVILSRLPNNPNALIIALAFALLAGPARRGRPSAYVWLGFLSGYILYEYVAYRPLAGFVLVGATLFSLWESRSGWGWRLGRPLVTAVLIAAMIAPLFLNRLAGGRIWTEYFNGWNRARASEYYNPQDSWSVSLQRKIDRASSAAGLFFFRGDTSLVRNLDARPLIDPVTGVLLIIGIGGAAAHLFHSVLGLTLLGALVTVAGTLVATGNFDVARVGGAVPYVHALAGFGAAAIAAGFQRSWGRRGSRAAVIVLIAAVATSAYLNAAFLSEFWSAETVRRAQRSNLAYLTVWLRNNIQPGEYVVGVAPGYGHVLIPNDAYWLLGGQPSGEVAEDVESGLRSLQAQNGPTLFFIFAGQGTTEAKRFVEGFVPGLELQFEDDPYDANGQILYAHLPAAPTALRERMAAWECAGIRSEFDIVGSVPSPKQVVTTVPYIEQATWPTSVRRLVHESNPHPREIQARFSGRLPVRAPGTYTFNWHASAGRLKLSIDGRAYRGPVALDAGSHDVEMHGTFMGLVKEPSASLYWKGPDSNGEWAIVPFYDFAAIDSGCALAAAPADAAR